MVLRKFNFDFLENHFNPGDGGLADGAAEAEGGPTDPPPHNFAKNQSLCPKFGMLISNYVKFVS